MAKGKIAPLSYEEARQAFFKKKFKSAERRLSRAVDYGLPPDKCAELADEVNFYRDALTGAMQWIPCSERLPEKCGKYLAAVESDAFPGKHYADVLQYDEIGWRDGCCYVNGVNYWMELPEEEAKDMQSVKRWNDETFR